MKLLVNLICTFSVPYGLLWPMEPNVSVQSKGGELQLTIKITWKAGASMMECEDQILAALNQAGSLATCELLQRFDADGAPITMGGVKLTSKGRVQKIYQTPYGTVPVARHVYQSSEGGATFSPLDQQARIINSSTPRFARMCASKYALMNSVQAQQDLSENHSREVSRCYLQEIVADVAAIAEVKEEHWRYADPELPQKVKTVGLGVDGVCMLFCEDGHRQAMVGTISLYDEDGARLHTVYLGSAPEYGKATFFERMEAELAGYKQRYSGATWVGVGDGAKDLFSWLEERTDQAILDFWHAASYLEKASAGVCPRKADRLAWFEDSRRRLKEEEGAAESLLKEMKSALDKRKPKGKTLQDLQAAVSYFQNHLASMNYAEYQRKCLPIGSGVTEAACKTLVKQRLCGSGMKWKYDGASDVLRLRSLILTEGRWQQFWDKISRYGF
jgi:hypothetical protein